MQQRTIIFVLNLSEAMKKIVDIFGIVLPSILILLGFIKLFSNSKTKSFNGLTMFIAILLLLVGVIRYLFLSSGDSHESGPKLVPLSVSKHSDFFNQSVASFLDAYYIMTGAFMKDDTALIGRSATQFKMTLDSFKVDELKQDTLIYETALEPLFNAKAEVESIIMDPSLPEKKASLNILSDHIRNLLVTIKYDQAKVYWQECPMAFGEEKPGNWLSSTNAVKNPYLSKMPECGGPKDTINFMMTDSTKR